jgi:CheY-like chemotaxis protein
MKILVVEDSPTLNASLVQNLKNDGHNVDSAEDGTTAVKLMRKNNYEYIFTDVNIPPPDGLGLKDMFGGKASIMLYTSGNPPKGFAELAARNGAKLFLGNANLKTICQNAANLFSQRVAENGVMKDKMLNMQ